jgi:1,2-diacylglycerol 3-alpha-glucosyltransferase
MKILMLCDFFDYNQQYQENLLVKYYVKNGHSVVVVASTIESIFDYVSNVRNNFSNEKVQKLDRVIIYRRNYSINLFNKIKKLRKVDDILKLEKPDLIFAHDIHMNISDSVDYLKKNPNSRLIMDYHADYSNSAKSWISLFILHKIIRRFYFNLYKRYISKIYPIVPGSTLFLNQVYGISYSNMELLPLGCDTMLANEIRNDFKSVDLRKDMGVSRDSLVIFTGGKLGPLKRTEVLISAVKLLTNINVTLLIVGDTAVQDREYGERIQQLSEGTDTRFLGWLPARDIFKYMLMSDIAVFPSSQSVLWQQSIGMYLPLVVGDSGNQSADYLNYANNVITLERQQIDEFFLANLISELYFNPNLLKMMREGAEKTAKELLSYDVICSKTLEIMN